MTFTSAASLSSLRVLQSVNKQIDQTQIRLSTGFKVNSAKDNASIWQTAQGIRSDIKTYDAVKTSLDFVKGTFDVAAKGAETVGELLNKIKAKVSTAPTTAAGSSDRATLKTEIAALQKQLLAVVNDAQFQGNNLLNAASTTKSYITSFSSQGVTTTADVTTRNVKTTDLETTVGTLTTTATLSTFDIDTVITDGDVNDLLTALTTAAGNVTTYAAQLGAASAAIESNQSVMTAISDIKERALASMIETDMGEETTRLQALQVKQQLAMQMLSMANASQQNVLRLFQ